MPPTDSMRRFGLLLALLLLSLALPTGARADTGWSLESQTLRSSTPAPPAREAKLAPAGPSGPLTLFAALGSAPKALVEGGERETRPTRAAPPRGFARPD
ncbi:MAG TPA: hypothetical protein VGR37_03205, partial [Longimicrobiaceae bacterium]|nr:hypothetical protein [Longimicrobiaceae bacterium]